MSTRKSPPFVDHASGVYISNRQFWTGLLGLLSILGLTPFMATQWVLVKVIDERVVIGIQKHNQILDAHNELIKQTASMSLSNDKEVILKLNDISERLARVEGALALMNGKQK